MEFIVLCLVIFLIVLKFISFIKQKECKKHIFRTYQNGYHVDWPKCIKCGKDRGVKDVQQNDS